MSKTERVPMYQTCYRCFDLRLPVCECTPQPAQPTATEDGIASYRAAIRDFRETAARWPSDLRELGSRYEEVCIEHERAMRAMTSRHEPDGAAIVTAARAFFDDYVRTGHDRAFPWMPSDLRDALVADYDARAALRGES